MNKKLIIGLLVLIIILVGLWFLGSQEKENDIFTIEEAREIAENWIENESPTYLFDGENLSLLREKEEVKGSLFSFVFEFQSTSAGYGDRTGEFLAQVITDHIMEVVVDNKEVVSAVTDGVFSEIDHMMLELSDEEETVNVKIFFGKTNDGEDLFPVERNVPNTDLIPEYTLLQLIDGPTDEEIEEGYYTSINKETEILNLLIANNIAYIDFGPQLEEGASGSATVLLIRNQINQTLTQFENIESVVISIEGETEDILQP